MESGKNGCLTLHVQCTKAGISQKDKFYVMKVVANCYNSQSSSKVCLKCRSNIYSYIFSSLFISTCPRRINIM